MKDISSHSLKELAYARHKGMLSFPDYRAKRAELLDELGMQEVAEDDGIDDTLEFVAAASPPDNDPPPRSAGTGTYEVARTRDNSTVTMLVAVIALILASIFVLAFFV